MVTDRSAGYVRQTTPNMANPRWPFANRGPAKPLVDNEIHHRGQGYVYLRELGIEPPPFWERG